MKKLFSLIMCILLSALTVNVFAQQAKLYNDKDSSAGFSATAEVCIVPAEKADSAVSVHSVLPSGRIVPEHMVIIKNIRQDSCYLPDILEQIDLISVAPRE